jgi:glycosyltransferase involved in cell wall biosynthesis
MSRPGFSRLTPPTREGVASGRTFTVVIPAHNAAGVLSEQLEALCQQDYSGGWDVVVVDNRSTDGTGETAMAFQERLDLRVVRAGGRASAAHARNVGIQAATGTWVVFVDADDVADRGLLSAYARMTDRYRIMGGHLDDWDLNDPVVASWRFALTAEALPVALERYPYVLTSNCAFRRDVFGVIGLFDEELRYFGEDVDISVRAALAGIDIGWVPDAVVHYRHRDSLRDLARQQFIWGRGSVVLFTRYGTERTLKHRVMYAASQALHVCMGAQNMLRNKQRKGQWIRFAAFVAGQFYQSARMRTIYLG